MMTMRVSITAVALCALLATGSTAETPGADCFDQFRLTRETASGFARIALACIHREYPNKPEHVMRDSTDVDGPAALHPSFYGCFDWHSSVHGHWMLARLLRFFPDLPEAAGIRRALAEDLTPRRLAAEAAYLADADRKSFERTYGWAWLLKLAEELGRWDDPDARSWSAALGPLVEAIRQRYLEFLPVQTYPIRRGVHPNTAFGIAFALDYARWAQDAELTGLLESRAEEYYLGDSGCPAAWEPDGDDFFSPCLMEADLVGRILTPDEFAVWLEGLIPELSAGGPASLLEPARVADRTDPKIVHLDGLNLSRAWCMRSIARRLPPDDPRRAELESAACRHAAATLPHVASGSYEGEHWLASFAVYLLTER